MTTTQRATAPAASQPLVIQKRTLVPIPVKPTHRVDIVQGPIALTQHYSAKWGKMVYVFGDRHQRDLLPCPSGPGLVNMKIDQFLKTVLDANPNKVIDIFLELRYLSKTENQTRVLVPEEEGYLFSDVATQWSSCLGAKKELCTFRNLRMHYTDLRLTPVLAGYHLLAVALLPALYRKLDDLYKESVTASFATKSDMQKEYDREDVDGWLNQVEEQLASLGANFNIDSLVTSLKVDKQIASIANPTVRVAVKQYFLKEGWYKAELRWAPARIRALLDSVRKYDLTKPLKVEQVNAVSFAVNGIIDWLSWLMDAYLVARMFRSFTNETGRYSDDPHYIIVYVGDFHGRRYRDFLDNLLKFERVTTAPQPVPQCLDIRTFNQPFFQDAQSKYIEAVHLKQTVTPTVSTLFKSQKGGGSATDRKSDLVRDARATIATHLHNRQTRQQRNRRHGGAYSHNLRDSLYRRPPVSSLRPLTLYKTPPSSLTHRQAGAGASARRKQKHPRRRTDIARHALETPIDWVRPSRAQHRVAAQREIAAYRKGKKDTSAKRYPHTLRPETQMYNLLKLPSGRKHQRRPRAQQFYLPVIRYSGLYYSAKTNVESKANVATDMKQAPQKGPAYCGTFYYVEPSSTTLLHLGTPLVAASKLHAMYAIAHRLKITWDLTTLERAHQNILNRTLAKPIVLSQTPTENEADQHVKAVFRAVWDSVLAPPSLRRASVSRTGMSPLAPSQVRRRFLALVWLYDHLKTRPANDAEASQMVEVFTGQHWTPVRIVSVRGLTEETQEDIDSESEVESDSDDEDEKTKASTNAGIPPKKEGKRVVHHDAMITVQFFGGAREELNLSNRLDFERIRQWDPIAAYLFQSVSTRIPPLWSRVQSLRKAYSYNSFLVEVMEKVVWYDTIEPFFMRLFQSDSDLRVIPALKGVSSKEIDSSTGSIYSTKTVTKPIYITALYPCGLSTEEKKALKPIWTVPFGVMDFLDQPLCRLARMLHIDTIVLQHEQGEYRAVSEILDTRTDTQTVKLKELVRAPLPFAAVRTENLDEKSPPLFDATSTAMASISAAAVPSQESQRAWYEPQDATSTCSTVWFTSDGFLSPSSASSKRSPSAPTHARIFKESTSGLSHSWKTVDVPVALQGAYPYPIVDEDTDLALFDVDHGR